MICYLKTCKKCLQIYGCRVLGNNFTLERWCDSCVDYLNDTCKIVNIADCREDGECIPCANKAEEE